jgi:hypothetical protein
MARKQRYPELYQSFAQILPEVFSTDSSLSQKQILEKMTERGICKNDDEKSFLEQNIGNYLQRAQNQLIIIGSGPHGGFKLFPSSISNDNQAEPASQEMPPNESYLSLESFLHLPVTIILSKYFESIIHSLPHITNRSKFGNPDLLMVRDSNTSQAVSNIKDVDSSTFKLVESVPPYILSSIELKYDLGGDRQKWIQALTQTSINSTWANESWLIFVDRQGNKAFEEMSDILVFARQNGIGVIELEVIDDPTSLSMKLHIQAAYRQLLSVNRQIANAREDLIRKAAELIQKFDEVGSYLDKDSDQESTAELILQAYSNLSAQTGFKDNMRDGFKRMKKEQKFQHFCIAIAGTEPISLMLSNDDYLSNIQKIRTGEEFDKIKQLVELLKDSFSTLTPNS